MPYDGSGNFTRIHDWTDDRDADIKIQASRMDQDSDDFAAAFNLTLLRTGIVPLSGNLRMGGNQITGLTSGTVSTPAIAFQSDALTGFYLNGSSRFAFTANGTKRFEIDSAGAEVTGTLEVSGASTLTGNVTIGGTLNVTGVVTLVQPLASASITGALNVGGNVAFGGGLVSGANVGAGDAAFELGKDRTLSGNSFIDLHSSVGLDFSARILRAPGVDGSLQINNTGAGDVALTTVGAGRLILSTANVERMRIGPTGFVGIGTAAPAGPLHVRDGANENLLVRGNITLASGVTLYSVNDVNNAVLPMEFAASEYLFAVGTVLIGAVVSNTNKLNVTGNIIDRLGNVRRLVKAAATSGVLTADSANQIVRATGGVTINNSVFAENDSVVILNKSGGAITITQGSGITMTDTNSNTGNRTLANNGWATIWFNAANDCHITGAGLT